MPTNNKDITKWTNRDLYTRIVDTFGMPHVKRRYKQEEEASKYTIPYIPEKEIMLTSGRYNTGKISTNLLDSIYDSSKRTGVPLNIALGLAGRESTLGIGRGFKEGQDVTATDLYSNWQQIQQPAPKSQIDKWNNTIDKEKRGEALTENDYANRNDFLISEQQRLEQHKPITEHPIDNALKFYQTGKYNPGDKNHSKMVEEDGKLLMSDPAIQKWLKTKTETQMKCGGRRKAQLGLDIREGGVAIPIANNMFYIDGRKHAAGGVAIGPNNKNGVEVEGGEIVEMIDSNHPSVGRQFKAGGQQQTMRVFSSVPFLRGVSPAELVLEGANPDAVFKAQEEFKDRNRINDDGTRYEIGGEKIINIKNVPNSFRGQKIGNKYIQIGVPPAVNKAKFWNNNFKDHLNSLNTELGTFATELINYGKKLLPKTARKYYAKSVNTLYNAGKVEQIDNTANHIGQISGILDEYKAGGIYIKPSKRGTFTAAATKHGMGGQEFASKVLANKEDYSPAMVKKANFAKNSSHWKKEFGGSMIYTINGNVKNELMASRPKATLGIKKEDEEKKKKNPNEARYSSRVQKGQTQEVTPKPVTTYNESADKNPDKYRYTRAAGFKNGNVPASPGNNQKKKDDNKTAKNTPWIGQYKTFRPEDWVGLGTNLAGHIAGYFANNSLLKKYPMPVKPVLFQAAKLKTTYNINPQLTSNRETEQMNLSEVGRNTSSSNTSLARKQRIMNEARDARNKLYGEKENVETQLINLDRRNRQDVYNRNITAYNDWLDKTYTAKTNKLLEKQKNMMSLINGIPSAVNHTLGVIETRRNANNSYRAIAAANPNVDARQIGGFDYYEGIGPDGTHKALYDKHQRFVRYI